MAVVAVVGLEGVRTVSWWVGVGGKDGWMEESTEDEYLKGGEYCLMSEFSRSGLDRRWRNGERFSLYLWRWC